MSQKKKIVKRIPIKKTGKNISKKKIEKKITKIKPEKPISNLIFAIVLIAISIATYIAFYPSLENEFTNWDDNSYVENNPVIAELSKENINEMFFSENKDVLYHMGNYHPLSMLSLTIDHALENKYPDTFKKKGMRLRGEQGKDYADFDPYIYHLHNLILHILNSLLVFVFVYLLFNNFKNKQKFLFASFTAILFAITTIHVESVTWISERKDVLYTFYFLLSAVFYLKFLSKRNYIWLFVSLLVFVLSLLSKGQAVSLAVTLLAIDFLRERKDWKNVILEKIPYFLLALVFGIIAIKAQSVGEAIHDISEYPFYHRILFASYGLTMYFFKLLIPNNLSAIYPYPYGEVPAYFWAFLAPAAVYLAAFIYFLKKNKIIAFSLAFFVINIFLVLQLLPVGSAIMADRYAYIPSIGFALILAYLLVWLSQKNKNMYYLSIALVVGYSLFLAKQTHTQTKIWKTSSSLWEHSLNISPKAVVAWNNWGSAIDKIATDQKNPTEKVRLKRLAVEKFTTACNLKIDYTHAYYNRGTSLKDIGMETHDTTTFRASIFDFNKAIELDNEFAEAFQNRAISRENIGDFNGAIADFNMAINYKPSEASLFSGRGVIKGKLGKFEDAILDFDKSIEVDPNHHEGYSNRGYAYYLKGTKNNARKNPYITGDFSDEKDKILKQYVEKAILDYNKSLQINADNSDALFNRAVAFSFQKEKELALADYNKIEVLKPQMLMLYLNRGITYASLNKFDLALSDYNKVQELNPQMTVLYLNRGLLFLNTSRKQEACNDFQTAKNLGNIYAQNYINAYCK